MKYTIQTKFKPGQKVWFMKNGRICSDFIKKIYKIEFYPTGNVSVEWFALENYSSYDYNSNNAFDSKSELIQSIS